MVACRDLLSVEDPPKGDGMPMKIFLQRTKLRDVGRANVVLDVSALSGHFRRRRPRTRGSPTRA